MVQEKILEVPLKQVTFDYSWNSRTGVEKLTAPKEGALPPGETGETEENEFHGLYNSIKTRGQDDAIDVIAKGDKYFAIAGFRRGRALSLLAEETGNKEATVKVIVRPYSPLEARMRNIRENTARRKLSARHRAFAPGRRRFVDVRRRRRQGPRHRP
jgi:uncharacterized ParB-like nuclease family protein